MDQVAAGPETVPVQYCTLRAEAQAALGEPAYGQRIDLVFLRVHPPRQAGRVVVGSDRHHRLGDQWPAIEFLGDEMHAATMLAVASIERPLMGVQAFIEGQQGRVDIQQAALVVTNEVATEDTHEASQHHQVGGEAIDRLGQGSIEGRAIGESPV